MSVCVGGVCLCLCVSVCVNVACGGGRGEFHAIDNPKKLACVIEIFFRKGQV